MPATHVQNQRWIDACIAFGAGFFILALFLSAVFDPTIRVLHFLQALIYAAILIATRQRRAWGFGVGVFIATFWNYTNLFVTTFVANGWQQLLVLVHTGTLPRPDLLVALIAAGGHFLIIFACAVGFYRLHPRAREWVQFVAGGILSVLYFIAIIFTTGRQYIPLIRRVFHM